MFSCLIGLSFLSLLLRDFSSYVYPILLHIWLSVIRREIHHSRALARTQHPGARFECRQKIFITETRLVAGFSLMLLLLRHGCLSRPSTVIADNIIIATRTVAPDAHHKTVTFEKKKITKRTL